MPPPPRPRRSLLPGEAEVVFLDADMRVLNDGTFVSCAVTGVPVPLDELKYWNVERQEGYANLGVAIARWRELNAAGGRS